MRKQYHFRRTERGLLAWDVDRLGELSRDGRVMDGMHRICRALVEGRETVRAVRSEVDPEPDYVDVAPSDLPYGSSG